MKSLYIKNSFKLLGLTSAILLGTASCSDLLKETVVSSISNDYIATTPGFVAATNAAYTPLRSFYATERGISMSEYGTDIYSAGADGSYKGFHFYDSQLTSSVDILAQLWDETYKGINTINAVIDRAPAVTGISDAVKTQRVGEMKYLRAHYYFILVQQFGPLDDAILANFGTESIFAAVVDLTAEVAGGVAREVNGSIRASGDGAGFFFGSCSLKNGPN